MGTSCSWLIIRGKQPEAVLAELGLRNMGRKNYDSPFGGTPLPNGWFVIYYGRGEFTNAEVEGLSRGCEVLACFLETHVMVSACACWKDGRKIWSVTHNSDEGLNHLEVTGQPPPDLTEIRQRLTQKQQEEGDDCDCIIEIPTTLAAHITGYDHENDNDVEFDTYVKPTFFQRLFGRK